GERLELRLDEVVRVAAREAAHVDADDRVVRDRLEHVPRERPGEVPADEVVLLALGLARVDEVRTPGDVDDRERERLVERDGRVAEAPDAHLVAERDAQRLADRDRDVLDRVVRVDVGVTRRDDLEVDERVLAQRREHVVVERDGRRDLGPTRPVEVELDEHARLGRRALDARGALHSPATSTRACRKARISSPVPIDTRSQPSGPVSRMSTPRSNNASQTECRSSNAPNSTKFASDSATSSGRPSGCRSERSHATVSSRRSRSSETWASSSAECARAARATACVTADRWYGRRTTRSASTSSRDAAR